MSNSKVKHVPSARAAIICRRTYSRPKSDGSFETWDEIVDRVISHQKWLWVRARHNKKLGTVEEAELDELRRILLEREGCVSGRTLWLGGTSVARTREASMFNCAFTKIETVHDVVDAFWLLLQGCGVGFEPIVGSLNGFAKPVKIEVVRSDGHTEKGIEYNQTVMEHTSEGLTWTLIVGDSAEAWAKSVGKLLAMKKPVDKIVLDFSEIRGPGIRLRGYGWLSSSDETLAPAFVKIAEILNRAHDRLLTRIDILDIVNHLGTTLSSRRSAEIALVPVDDLEAAVFATAKKDFWLHGNEHRQQSNNSLVFSQPPSEDMLTQLFATMQEAGGSEPGFINGQQAKLRGPWFAGVNPCVPGDTNILTDVGYVAIGDVVGQEVNVWNGKEFSTVKPFSTGVNTLVRVDLSDGTHLTCTPYHKFVLAGDVRAMAEELRPGDRMEKFAMPVVMAGQTYPIDAYSQGFYSGDGNEGYEFSWIYEPKEAVRSRLVGKVSAELDNWDKYKWTHGPMFAKTFVPVHGSGDYCLNWLAGLLDADGTVTRDINGNGLQISSVNKEFLSNVRLMLTRLGVRAKLNLMHRAAVKAMPDGRGGSTNYECQDCWRLLIGNTDTYDLIQLGLKCNRLRIHDQPPQRDARRFVTVESVTDLQTYEETFCFTEPKNNTGTFNGIVTGQCAEILLPNKGFCNLVEINLSKFNGKPERLWHVARILARANYRQTCVNLEDGILQRAWHENNEFLRLCGVGVTGVAEWEFKGDRAMWRQLRSVGRRGADGMAHELGMPRPKAVTTVKPSGTLSKIMDTTEGVHTPLGQFVFNNVRFSKHDPYIKSLKRAGYRVFDDPSSSDAVLVTFPVEYKTTSFTEVGGRQVNLETAIDQLERYKLLMECYVDHNCSITVSYSPDEVPAIVKWLHENWNCYVGVSFIYRNDPTKTAADLGYLYLPQEVVTEEAYRAYAAKLKPLKSPADGTVELKEEADDYEIDTGTECGTGMCPLR